MGPPLHINDGLANKDETGMKVEQESDEKEAIDDDMEIMKSQECAAPG